MSDSAESDTQRAETDHWMSDSGETDIEGAKTVPQAQKGTPHMIINGKEENVATPITVAELIESKGLRADRVAVELNGEIVPRTKRAQTQLKGTDTLEIVTFVQGG